MKAIKISLALAVLFLFSISLTAFAAPDDSVLSQHVKEADGTTGQDTNTGSGVKTGHIQDGAVTTSKIVDGSVTDAKITGPISASKISSTGLNADTVDGKHASDLASAVHTHSQSQVTDLEAALAGKSDVTHNHDGVYQKHYRNVIVVSKDGNGNFTDPGAAVNSITDASENNPYLVKILPGVYTITSTIAMKQYVDLEGSGEGITKFTATGIQSDNTDGCYGGRYAGGVIALVPHSELRSLTVESIGMAGQPSMNAGLWSCGWGDSINVSNVTVIARGESTNYAMWISRSYPILINSTLKVSGSNNYNTGLVCLTEFYDSTDYPVKLKNVTASADGYGSRGFDLRFARAEIINVTTRGFDMGMAAGYSTLKISHSVIEGTTYSIYVGSSSVYVANTMLSGGPVYASGGQAVCAGVYDENYAFYTNTCP